MKSYQNNNGLTVYDVNTIHSEALFDFFHERIGQKVFIMLASFPYLYIGIIEDVVDDVVLIDVETTSVPALENKKWWVHIDSIEVFYIEEPNGPKIPRLGN